MLLIIFFKLYLKKRCLVIKKSAMFKILSFDQKPDFYHFSQSVELKQKNNKNGLVAVRTCVCVCVRAWSEMLVQPQRCVEEAVNLCVHSGQRMSIFRKPQQPDFKEINDRND